jgi:asparagine synthetase A
MKVFETDKEKIYFDKFDVEELSKIIDTQHKIIQYLKKIINKVCSAFWSSLMILLIITRSAIIP